MGNEEQIVLLSNLTVKELFDKHPKVIDIFIELNLACIGCPIDKFHTLADIANIYELEIDILISKIQTVIKKED